MHLSNSLSISLSLTLSLSSPLFSSPITLFPLPVAFYSIPLCLFVFLYVRLIVRLYISYLQMAKTFILHSVISYVNQRKFPHGINLGSDCEHSVPRIYAVAYQAERRPQMPPFQKKKFFSGGQKCQPTRTNF